MPLFYSTHNAGYSLSKKPRELETGVVVEYVAADGLEHHFRRLYDKAGLPGASSHTGRRTFASGLLAKGVSSEDVRILLGHEDIDITGAYLVCTEHMIEEALRGVL
ncbi:MAG: tyrosine-type recombinase/integrase [Betaproteobacteria bacterium]|nr:tyrosine-type recombinase/integrase [Betaproteobacteria bacterium]